MIKINIVSCESFIRAKFGADLFGKNTKVVYLC